jgi:hypothetical protein
MENKFGHTEQRQWHPLEYAHVFLWLVKDLCWAQGWKMAGSLMVPPTILVAFIITWLQRRQRLTLIHNLAISVWISSNSLWMLAEFYEMETQLKPFSTFGFVLGLLILLSAYSNAWYRSGRKNNRSESR